MIPTTDQERDLVEAVRAAAKAEILPRFRNLDTAAIDTKANADDLVTIADRRAEEAITTAVARIMPTAEVIGEEAVAEDSSLLERIGLAETAVIIDPIDGTWNFAMGLSIFGVLLAVTHEGETVFGLLYDPVNDDWVVARRGGGTWFCTADGRKRQLHLDAVVRGETKFAGYGAPALLPEHMRERFQLDLLKRGRVMDLRCACHTYRMMCFGVGNFGIDLKLMPWDHAAGALAFTEAGGCVGLLDGRDYRPTIHDGYMLSARDAETMDRMRKDLAWMAKPAALRE
ncbi:inositol monophosphatase family protein [Tropicimonas marinistellae]|uniref:inositol monophosphatase family protein n=1 Tax=Tropicimonas marinistellae TaxID=1739787 RepID=UPI00082B96A2|nr:inositol monophosphatase family protein [Tropicimonas marinistellae]